MGFSCLSKEIHIMLHEEFTAASANAVVVVAVVVFILTHSN